MSDQAGARRAQAQGPDEQAADEPGARTATGQDLTANVGVATPGSPLDEQGFAPLPEEGGPGADDPAAGTDLAGRDQADTAIDAGGTPPDTTAGARGVPDR